MKRRSLRNPKSKQYLSPLRSTSWMLYSELRSMARVGYSVHISTYPVGQNPCFRCRHNRLWKAPSPLRRPTTVYSGSETWEISSSTKLPAYIVYISKVPTRKAWSQQRIVHSSHSGTSGTTILGRKFGCRWRRQNKRIRQDQCRSYAVGTLSTRAWKSGGDADWIGKPQKIPPMAFFTP